MSHCQVGLDVCPFPANERRASRKRDSRDGDRCWSKPRFEARGVCPRCAHDDWNRCISVEPYKNKSAELRPQLDALRGFFTSQIALKIPFPFRKCGFDPLLRHQPSLTRVLLLRTTVSIQR